MTLYGSGALALSALIAQQSPLLTTTQKYRMAQVLNGSVPSTPSAYTIVVRATKILCRVSDVAITQRGCTLTFGTKTVSLNGRAANELYATMDEAGIRGEGAAGTIYEGASSVVCTINFAQLREASGAGASCTYTALD